MAFIPHARPSAMIQAMWEAYCLCSSCASLKFFLECHFWSQVLFLVREPRSGSISTARFFECVLLTSPPWWCQSLANLPQLLISFPLASTRSGAGYCSTLGLLPPGFFEQGFSFVLFFMLLNSRECKALDSALGWFHLRQNLILPGIVFQVIMTEGKNHVMWLPKEFILNFFRHGWSWLDLSIDSTFLVKIVAKVDDRQALFLSQLLDDKIG